MKIDRPALVFVWNTYPGQSTASGTGGAGF
jgi:hypothetical protein